MSDTGHRSGYCAIVGRPNAGKSTLLNHLMGVKLAIATHKPQTTRDRILGILNRPHGQICFVDTPGLHNPKGGINKYMVRQAEAAILDADVILWMAEVQPKGSRALSKGMNRIHELIESSNKPWLLALNKVDRVNNKQEILPQIALWQEAFDPPCVVPISAQDGEYTGPLLDEIIARLPAGPPLFPDEFLTDRSERYLTTEVIREKAILETREELPYSVAVTVDDFDESKREDADDPLVSIIATLHVEREGQKRIVVGERGKVVKRIGMRARRDLRRLLGCRVYLDLFVRVTPDWSSKETRLRDLGYDV